MTEHRFFFFMGLAAQRGNIVAAEPDLQRDAVVFNVLRKQSKFC